MTYNETQLMQEIMNAINLVSNGEISFVIKIQDNNPVFLEMEQLYEHKIKCITKIPLGRRKVLND